MLLRKTPQNERGAPHFYIRQAAVVVRRNGTPGSALEAAAAVGAIPVDGLWPFCGALGNTDWEHEDPAIPLTRRARCLISLLIRHILQARPERFELPTFGSVDRRSIQLSYGRRGQKDSRG